MKLSKGHFEMKKKIILSTLPCMNEERVTKQVHPTINLLTNLDELHPEILQKHKIVPDDYKKGLVFRSAIESIRGKFIASSVTEREGLVNDILDNLLAKSMVADYKRTSAAYRYDFEIHVKRDPDHFIALEVKGGEGNSINISERPIWAKEFGVWCHLDGAIVNQPANGAHSIINRLTNELVRRKKLVDVLFFKDILCGTSARPCPKYPGKETTIGLNAAPDIFLFPKTIPSAKNPNPPIHSLKTLKLPKIILQLFHIGQSEMDDHLWKVNVEIVALPNNKMRRIIRVFHKDNIVDESISRSWR